MHFSQAPESRSKFSRYSSNSLSSAFLKKLKNKKQLYCGNNNNIKHHHQHIHKTTPFEIGEFMVCLGRFHTQHRPHMASRTPFWPIEHPIALIHFIQINVEAHLWTCTQWIQWTGNGRAYVYTKDDQCSNDFWLRRIRAHASALIKTHPFS